MLGGSFLEAGRVQRQPEIAASEAAVHGLLDYVYGGQPEVNLESGLERLGLVEAFGLPKLANAIETGFRASLNSNSALQVLQEAHGLHTLKAACEEKVAEDFETCSQQPDFGKLDPGQLAGFLDAKRWSSKLSLIGSRSPRTESFSWCASALCGFQVDFC